MDTDADTTAGELLRERIEHAFLEAGVEADSIDEAVIDQACNTADLLAELEAAKAELGLTTKGHRGVIVSPVVTELRHQATLLNSQLRLLRAEMDKAVAARQPKGGRVGGSPYVGTNKRRSTGPVPAPRPEAL